MSGHLLDEDVIDASKESAETLAEGETREADGHGIAEDLGPAHLKAGPPSHLTERVAERHLLSRHAEAPARPLDGEGRPRRRGRRHEHGEHEQSQSGPVVSGSASAHHDSSRFSVRLAVPGPMRAHLRSGAGRTGCRESRPPAL